MRSSETRARPACSAISTRRSSARARTARSPCRPRHGPTWTGDRRARRPPLPPYIAASRPDDQDRPIIRPCMPPGGRGRGAHRGAAFHPGAAGGLTRRGVGRTTDPARRRRHLPAGQGGGHRRAPDARRMGRGLRRDRGRANAARADRRPHRRGRHHLAAAAGKRRGARRQSQPFRARPRSSSPPATASAPSTC